MKKLVVLSMLVFAAFLTACGGGVATVSPPEQTENYLTAHAPTVEVSTEPGESQGGEVATIEPTLVPPTTEVIPTETEQATETVTEAATEVVTEAVTEIAATATEETTEIPTQTATATVIATLAPTELPTNTPTATLTLIPPSEVPSEIPTEEGGAGGTGDQTLVPTETATHTATATFTNTLAPTETPTLVPTDTPIPTNTATLAPTDTQTPVPTDTPSPSHTATFTLTVTATFTLTPTVTASLTLTFTATATFTHTPSVTSAPTETYTPTPTLTNSPTLTPSVTPTPTNTPFVPPQEFATYASEALHLSLDYPAEWGVPVYDEPFVVISPDGTDNTFPAAVITRGSAQFFAEALNIEDISSPQDFMQSLVANEENAEVTKVSGYSYPAFEAVIAQEDLNVRVLLFVVNDTDWILLAGAAPIESFSLYSETTFQQIASSIEAEIIEPTATPSPIPSNTPRPTATWTPTATPRPILGETYTDEEAGFGFNYPEGADVSEGENSVTVAAEVENVPGEIYFVRARPETLAEQGVICESRDPVEALRCINPEVEPTYADRYEKFGSPAWYTAQNVDSNAVISYIVAAGPEWIFIRLTAPASDFTTANLQLFQPILDSVFIEVQPVDIFGRWATR
ncbi:MAG: hypothetical protein HY862_10810 [Chloroflexi bacterium]|nr:hypothetical protein [Chloroflexota bacterium]